MDILLFPLSIIERKNILFNVSWYTSTCFQNEFDFIGLIIGSRDETFYLHFKNNQPLRNQKLPDDFFPFITSPIYDLLLPGSLLQIFMGRVNNELLINSTSSTITKSLSLWKCTVSQISSLTFETSSLILIFAVVLQLQS